MLWPSTLFTSWLIHWLHRYLWLGPTPFRLKHKIIIYPKWWSGHQERVEWPTLNWMIQPAPRPIFSGESESEEGMIIAGLYVFILLNMVPGRVMWPAPNGMICMSLDVKFKWDMVSDERFWMSGLQLHRIWHMIYQRVLFLPGLRIWSRNLNISSTSCVIAGCVLIWANKDWWYHSTCFNR